MGRFYAVKIWASGNGLALPASRFELCVGHINDFLGFGVAVVPKHPDFGFKNQWSTT
jgi:hypothetical protein